MANRRRAPPYAHSSHEKILAATVNGHYLLMKLSAFADRKEDGNKDLGRHHALDTYSIVGMMTEAEYDRTRALADRSRSDPHFTRVCDVVAGEFATPTSMGMLRLREHRLFREEFRLDEFAAVLGEIFTR